MHGRAQPRRIVQRAGPHAPQAITSHLAWAKQTS
jgi:hypothetical protein